MLTTQGVTHREVGSVRTARGTQLGGVRGASRRYRAQRRGVTAPVQARTRGLEELANVKREKATDSVPTVTELEWQTPLQIVKYPSPILRATNAKVGVFDDSLKQLAAEMMEVMYEDDGVGLAAPQVGVNIRMMVFNPTGDPTKKDAEMILVNPELISTGTKSDIDVEGCLSFRGENGLEILGDVERSKLVKVRALNEDGKQIKVAFKDWVARIFQHEFDHLNGVLFPDRFPEGLKAEVKPLLMQMEQAYGQSNPDVEYKPIR